MTDNPTGPELFTNSMSYLDDINDGEAEYTSNSGERVDNRLLYATMAVARAIHAHAAVMVMIAENMHEFAPWEMEDWREVIPAPPLKECKGKEIRRPACAERHTEDCAYADPPQEPEHELLPVGTRVLVSDWQRDDDGVLRLMNPEPGKIVGYALGRSKYRWRREWNWEEGRYSEHDQWAFVDNRVQVHPDGPGCQPVPEPVEQEPTGPRIYVQNHHGKQGHVVRFGQKEDGRVCGLVQWYTPGSQPVWRTLDLLTIIAESQVERCPNGQTRDECGSGENQCELCLAAEDAEAEAIEGSMGL
jgi:hypothetical protein